jgi:glycosyltransferase involved in cell wall biosynthesis
VAEGVVDIDPRVASALAWCKARWASGLAVAAPFPLTAPTRAFLATHHDVSGLVLWPMPDELESDQKSGAFVPEEFTWRLPAATKRIVFIDSRGALTARMLAVALRFRVRSIIYWHIDDWRRRPVWYLAAVKLADKLTPRCAEGGGLAGAPCRKLLRARYRRAFRRLLQAAHLSAGPWGGCTPSVERCGIVLACPTLVAGGAERQIVNTALALRARTVARITVLVARLHSPPGNAFFLPPLRAAGIEVREIRSGNNLSRWMEAQVLARSPQGHTLLHALKRLPNGLAQDVADLCVELSALQPAVVHCWLDYSNIRAGLAAACCGVPRIILSGRNVGPQHFPYIFEPFMQSAYLAMLRHSNVVLTNNSHGGARDYAAWLGIVEGRIPVVYNGIDHNAIGRASAADIRALRRNLGVAPDAIVVGGLFRFSAEKRPMLWLEVAARVLKREASVEFVLFGAGPLAPSMQAFIDARGLRTHVRLAPPTPHNALAISSFDLLLLTSQWEGTPNVAIEAQALGTPVVLAGCGGASEALIDGETGCYVEQANVETIADAVTELVRHPERRACFASAGPAFTRRRFGIARMIAHTMELYGLEPDLERGGPRASAGNQEEPAVGA